MDNKESTVLFGMTAAALETSGPMQDRYLTLPLSRVVVNPFNFESQARETTQVQFSNQPSMPLHFGYCDPYAHEKRGYDIRHAAMLAEKSETAPGWMECLWQAEMAHPDSWRCSGMDGRDVSLSFEARSIRLQVRPEAETPWQHVESTFHLEDVQDTYLTIRVDEVSQGGGNVAVKLNKVDGEEDVLLLQTTAAGTYTFSIQEASQWTGAADVTVKVFAVSRGAAVSFSEIRVEKCVAQYRDALSYTTAWRPDYLSFEAAYPHGSSVAGKDFFYDEKTVVRIMEAEAKAAFMVYGAYNGSCQCVEDTVVVSKDTYRYAVCLRGYRPVFFPSAIAALSGEPGRKDPYDGYGVWAYQIEPSAKKSLSLCLATAFDTADKTADEVAFMARKPGDDCPEKLAACTENWNRWLAKVPRPGTFALTKVDANGLTPADICYSYYNAWVQIIGNVLPPNPEKDYPYASFAAGKASMWAYGHEKCAYAATWESIYGMQYYAQIDPDVAWEMYRGIMTLVDDKGQIGGESLPPNNARVAWILHTVKPDNEALAEIEPLLERHLEWRFDNPRWIYGPHTPDVLLKDMDFVASALIDIPYLLKIQQVLGIHHEAHWQARIRTLYAQMQAWFFDEERAYPVQYFTLDGNHRRLGNPSWTTKAFHIPGLDKPEFDGLMRLFRDKIYDPEKIFCGMVMTKYEPYQYTVYGLLEHGYIEEACALAEAALRDVCLSGIKAEGYYNQADDTRPLPDGVRPSMFGCALTIDNLWLLNGIRLDEGMPRLVNAFGEDGGLENYTLQGGCFAYTKAGETYRIRLTDGEKDIVVPNGQDMAVEPAEIISATD